MKFSPAFFALGALLLASTASATNGVSLGGSVTKFAVDPATPSVIYAVSGSNASATGVYKSTDSGATWTFIYPTLNTPSDIELDLQDPSTVYVSADEAGSTAAIFKSTDSGATWTEADSGILPVGSVFLKDWIGPMAVDPVNEGVVYAAGGNTGLYKSTDGGQSWTSINSGIDTITAEDYTAAQILVDPVVPTTVYFSFNVTVLANKPETVAPGLYKSTDSGATWNATGLSGLSMGAVAIDPENHLHLVASAGETLMFSTDGGTTWTSGANCCGGIVSIAIDPSNSNHILVGSLSSTAIWPSFDGGATLKFGSGLAGISVMTIAFDPVTATNVYVGTSGTGVYISRNGGTTWTQSIGAVAPPITIHVPADQPTIQAAINAASYGDTVVVAPGTYYEKLDFLGEAITVESSGGAAVTTLDGNNSGPIVSFTHSEGNTSVLQGFTLTHASTSGFGAAISINGASPTISDDVFVDNSQPTGSWGTAIGGNDASPIIVGNLFSNNTCTGTSLVGVVAFTNGSSPTIVDNVFFDNSCPAVSITVASSFTPYVSNNTIVGNSIGIRVDARGNQNAQVYRNNIVYDNGVGLEVDFGSAANYPTWKNNLVYGSTTADYQGIPDQTGTNGNISSDPKLKDSAGGDVHLLYGSPAIDSGDMSAPTLPTTDYYGKTRVYAGMPGDSAVVDIGASEYQPPLVTAADGSVSTAVSTTANGTLGSSNADPGEPLVFALATLPMHGSVTLTNAATGAFQYVPVSGYIGSDRFTFDITDPYGTVSNTATEQVTVADPAPTSNGGSVNTAPNTAVTGALSATAAFSGQTLTFTLVSHPTHGTVSLTPSSGQFSYTPAQGYHGTDSFTFDVADQYGAVSNTATEKVTIGSPTANNGHVVTTPDITVAGTLSATTAYAGQKLTFSLVSNPAHGSVSLTPNSGRFRYTPTTGYAGMDSFTFKATDSFGVVSNVATEIVTVTDSAPKARNTMILVIPNRSFSGAIKATTAYAGQVLSYTVVSQPAHGIVAITDIHTGAYTYTPNHPFMGKDSFTFQAVDQWGTASNIATVSVTVY